MATEHDHDPHGHGSAPADGPIQHETTDINLDKFGKLVAGFIIVMGLIMTTLFVTMGWLNRRVTATQQQAIGSMVEPPSTERPAMRDEPNTMAGSRMPAGPPLLTNEPLNLRDYRTGHRQRLESYGWVDRGNAVVHVPIARAIELTLERGLPVATPDAFAEPIDGEMTGEDAPEGVPVDEATELERVAAGVDDN